MTPATIKLAPCGGSYFGILERLLYESTNHVHMTMMLHEKKTRATYIADE